MVGFAGKGSLEEDYVLGNMGTLNHYFVGGNVPGENLQTCGPNWEKIQNISKIKNEVLSKTINYSIAAKVPDICERQYEHSVVKTIRSVLV